MVTRASIFSAVASYLWNGHLISLFCLDSSVRPYCSGGPFPDLILPVFVYVFNISKFLVVFFICWLLL